MTHSSYLTDPAFTCYLCGLPIPLNIFRGSIDGVANPLALQWDHVLPRVAGGLDAEENLKPTHRYCNASKNKHSWTFEKKTRAVKLLEKLLKEPLEVSWIARRVDRYCLFENCSKIARSGDYWDYCAKHAIELGEDSRLAKCTFENCGKLARSKSGGFCTSHSKGLGFKPTVSKCSFESCQKQIQVQGNGKWCIAHARELGLFQEKVRFGLKSRAGHFKNHGKPSRSCFFCVELEGRCDWLQLSEVLEAFESPRAVSKRAFGVRLRLTPIALEHFWGLAYGEHSENCLHCLNLAKLREDWL